MPPADVQNMPLTVQSRRCNRGAMQLMVRSLSLSYDGDTSDGDTSDGDTPDGTGVLKDASFTLEAGEHALLLGPSGSGKSSLLNIICGLQTPDSGSVTLGGDPVNDTVRKRHMGIIFQTLRLVSALSVRGNLLLAQRLATGAQDSAAVDKTLEQLGIAARAKARPFELSQGEAQRAAIARGLVVSPKLLIADEPTSALDAANTRNVAQLLIEAANSAGASLLIATHDDRLTQYFHRTLTLQNGTLQDGRVAA